ncbi:MAG: hypothetical protein KDA42_11535 [Planctomycetales bacterium]|nr:hypothetical protein [Planctomycetales bacterium]
MGSGDSGMKWVLACGGVALVLLLACGGAAIFVLPKAFTGVKGMIASEQQKTAFARSWRAPAADADAQRLFPEEVDFLPVANRDPSERAAEFGIDLAGEHARYESPKMAIDVFAYRATRLEKEALFRRVDEAIENGDYNYRFKFGSMDSDRFTFSVGPPHTQGSLWWSKGWLFVLLTDSEDELESFQQAYLTMIQADSQEATSAATETPAETGSTQ